MIKRRTQALSPQETRYLEAVGAHIRALRDARGMGMEELADLAGIHRTHLWKIEKGRLNAGAITYMRLAIRLGLAPGDLFPLVEEQPLPPLQEVQSGR